MNDVALHGAAASALIDLFGDQHMQLSTYVWARAILSACFVAILILAILVYSGKLT
jgi:hypothetical protein